MVIWFDNVCVNNWSWACCFRARVIDTCGSDCDDHHTKFNNYAVKNYTVAEFYGAHIRTVPGQIFTWWDCHNDRPMENPDIQVLVQL